MVGQYVPKIMLNHIQNRINLTGKRVAILKFGFNAGFVRKMGNLYKVFSSYLSLISTTVSPLSTNIWACCNVLERIFFNSSFEVFPHVNQIICGGLPCWLTSSVKSLSLLITTIFCLRAFSNIS